jgi:hypothetical protein
MKAAFKNLGQQFDDIAARNPVPVDAELVDGAIAAATSYTKMVSASGASPLIKNVATNLIQKLKAGKTLSGREYQTLRSDLGKALKSSDAFTRDAAKAMRDVLDDALERAAAISGNLDDVATLQTIRPQYRDLLAVEKSVGGAGEIAEFGKISPAKLRSAISAQDKRGYVTGQRDLGDLSRAGSAMMKPLPQSGTQPRLSAVGAAAPVGSAGLGGLLGMATGNPVLAGVGAAAGAAVPMMRNAFTGTSAGQAYYANQLLGAGPNLADQRMLGILATLAGQRE